MKTKTLITVFTCLLVSYPSAGEQTDLHSFMSGDYYSGLRHDRQIYYVMGLADAFAYLAQKTGFLEGISKCYRQDKVNSAHLMNQFNGYVENYKFYDKDYSGPDPKTLPAAEAFHQFNKLLCEGIIKDK